MLFVLLTACSASLVFCQICLSDYDCLPQERCVTSTGRTKRCFRQALEESYATPPAQLDAYPTIRRCFFDSNCQPFEVCVVSQTGERNCLKKAQNAVCFSDKDCGPSGACTEQLNGSRHCQLTTGNVVTSLSPLGGSCRRDSDCETDLQCVSRNGVLSCLVVSGNNVAPANLYSCETALDCPSGEKCIYSVGEGRLICMNVGGGPVSGGEVTSVLPPVGSLGLAKTYDEVPPAKESVATFEEAQFNRDPEHVALEANLTIIPTYDVIRKPMDVPRHTIIDPAALPCEFDYQCRMGEACTGFVHMVDRNVTVCQYDVTKPNRTCMFHSDCIHGQRCEEMVKGEPFVCKASLLATLGDVDCFFDYECSGGDKCINVSSGATKMFRCRAPKVADPRRNQHCRTNNDCPFQQVCRHVAEISICVDVGSSVSSAGTQEIQKKIVDFVQNLLFARA